jgi:hypothetical protein
MTLCDQLDLTLELLCNHDCTSYLDPEPVETWPPNVIRFRVRRPRNGD